MARNYTLTQTGAEVQSDLDKIEGAKIEGRTITIDGVSITPVTEETDPTVPAWAKELTKPNYSLAELQDDATHRTVTDVEKVTWNGKQDTLVSGTNIKTVNGENILGSGNIVAGDPNAVKYTEQTLTDAQKAQARTNIGAGTYSKPSSGIPEADLAAGVIPTVPTDVVKYSPQSLTDAQKGQARTNIDAIGYDVEGSGTPVELGLEKVQNKVTSLSNGSTDVQYPSAKAVYNALATKQDTLESGVNIKTINGNSLLGSGDLEIQGGGDTEVFWAEYGVTTYAEVVAAFNEGASVVMSYDSRLYILADTDRIDAAWFTADMGTELHRARVTKTNQWVVDALYPQMISDKVSDIPANRTSTSKYPNTKAVYDALGKYGVVSQTQTWTGGSSTGYTYTMSNQVRGLIPQANIDLYESAGAVFNETTGYFELNGLTDLSYEEMQVVFIRGTIPVSSEYLFYYQDGIRTNLPCNRRYLNFGQGWFARNSSLEVIALNNNNDNKITNATYFVYSAAYLKRVIGVIAVESSTGLSSTPFGYAYSLESIQVKGLKTNMSFEKSPRLSAASVAYMINHAGTTAITITLHATAYARAIADADVQAALAAKTNVTLASA